MYKGVIFDLDGVLVDSYECWRSLVNEGLAFHGRGPLTKEEFDASWGQGVDADQRMFFPTWTVDEVIGFYNRRFVDHAKWVKLENGAASVLQTLKEQNFKLAVASNSPQEVVRLVLQESGLLEFLDYIVGVDQVKEGKPAPDLVLHAVSKLHLTYDEACYVGDSVFDEQAATAAGVFFIGYRRPGRVRIESLEELIAVVQR